MVSRWVVRSLYSNLSRKLSCSSLVVISRFMARSPGLVIISVRGSLYGDGDIPAFGSLFVVGHVIWNGSLYPYEGSRRDWLTQRLWMCSHLQIRSRPMVTSLAGDSLMNTGYFAAHGLLSTPGYLTLSGSIVLYGYIARAG